MKRALCLFLIAITLCTTFSVTAFAATPSGQETTVSYTVDTWYTVLIPESIDLSSSTGFDILAHSMLDIGKRLYVKVDSDLSFVDGLFMLYKDGDKNASSMACTISIEDITDFDTYSLEDTGGIVAVFESANQTPIEYGHIRFYPGISGTQEFGTYYGTLYFMFSVE